MRRVYSIFLLLTILVSCSKDETDFEYNGDIKQVEFIEGGQISKALSNTTVSAGDSIYGKPDVILPEEVIADTERYTYKWYIIQFDDETHIQDTIDTYSTKDIAIEVDLAVGVYTVVFEVLDNKYDVKSYPTRSDITVKSLFDNNGLIVLSEDASGNSRFNYIRPMKSAATSINPSIYNSYVEFDTHLNLYEEGNGEILGTKPIGLIQHYCGENDTQMAIFQETGGVIDITSPEMMKDLEYSSLFDGGVYPEGVQYFTMGHFMKNVDLLTDQDGRIFQRFREYSDSYHAGTFISEPLEKDGEVLDNCVLYRGDYSSKEYAAAIVYDRDKGEFFLILDGEDNRGGYYDNVLNNAGKIIDIPLPEIVGDAKGYIGYNSPDIEVIDAMFCPGPNWGKGLYILYKEAGNYYLQIAVVGKSNVQSYSPIFTSSSIKRYSIDMSAVSGDVEHLRLNRAQGGTPYGILISAGKNLYVASTKQFNVDTFVAQRLYTAESNITNIASVSYAWGSAYIGCEDGSVIGLANHLDEYLTPLNPVPADEDLVLFKAEGFGKIVSIAQKSNKYH